MNNNVYNNHFARKRFSQHFLNDRYIINAIVSAIHPQYGQEMIEIGPGLGALTQSVLEHIDRITVIELDSDLTERLTNHFFLQSRIKVIQKNVMKVDFATLSARVGQPLRIFGNLPYNISTPIMFYLFNYMNVIHDMHFMFQKEVVDRLVASPNNKSYGRLSIMAQYYCKIIKVIDVQPTSFRPIPKVNSAMIRLIPHTILPFPVYDVTQLALLTNVAFNQRRKMLRNSLNTFFSVQQLAELGIDATLRAENISIEYYCRLANVLAERHLKKNNKCNN